MFVLEAYGRRGYRGGVNMPKTSVSVQPMFLYIVNVICNSANQEEVALIEMKKRPCGSQMACVLGPEPPNFFHLT